MNASIKRRQTMLIAWLSKTLQAMPLHNAETGSRYVEFSSRYAGKSIVRFSDHLSRERTYIHVILSPLNASVIVNYKNFIWSGSFKESKSIIYTLILSSKVSEIAATTNAVEEEVVKVIPTFDKATKASIEQAVGSWNAKLRPKIYEWIKRNPDKIDLMLDFAKSHGAHKKADKEVLLEAFIKKH